MALYCQSAGPGWPPPRHDDRAAAVPWARTVHDQGTVLAQGTAAAPIVVTSNATNPAPGDWQYIAIDGKAASGSKLNYVQMFYGSWNGGDSGMLSVTGGASPAIGNSVFAQATQHGVWADDTSRPTLGNCIFAGDASSAISVPADDGTLMSGTSLGPGQAGVELRDTAITHSGTWHAQAAPFIVDGGVLDAKVSLTVEPGTLLKMAGEATLSCTALSWPRVRPRRQSSSRAMPPTLPG